MFANVVYMARTVSFLCECALHAAKSFASANVIIGARNIFCGPATPGDGPAVTKSEFGGVMLDFFSCVGVG